nr:Tssor-4 [Plutella xylostella]
MLKSIVIFQTIVIVALAKPNYGRGATVAESCPTGMVKELGRCVWPDTLWKSNAYEPGNMVGDVDRCPTGMVEELGRCVWINKLWKSKAYEPDNIVGDVDRCPTGMVKELGRCVWPDRLWKGNTLNKP